MNINSILDWLEATSISEFIVFSVWAFPTIESFHVIGLGLVFGTIAIVDLRLIGLASKNRRITELLDDCLRWTWLAFVLAVITGGLMFMSNANLYYYNDMFRWKMVLLALAGINMAVFQFYTARTIADWDDGTVRAPAAARVAGVLSLSLWLGVIAFGRWIGFTLYQLPI